MPGFSNKKKKVWANDCLIRKGVFANLKNKGSASDRQKEHTSPLMELPWGIQYVFNSIKNTQSPAHIYNLKWLTNQMKVAEGGL